MVAYSALRAALKTILAVYRLTQRHVGEEIGEGESPMSLWINNKVGVPQFTDAVRRRVSEKVLKWLQKKHGQFTGQKLDVLKVGRRLSALDDWISNSQWH